MMRMYHITEFFAIRKEIYVKIVVHTASFNMTTIAEGMSQT